MESHWILDPCTLHTAHIPHTALAREEKKIDVNQGTVVVDADDYGRLLGTFLYLSLPQTSQILEHYEISDNWARSQRAPPPYPAEDPSVGSEGAYCTCMMTFLIVLLRTAPYCSSL